MTDSMTGWPAAPTHAQHDTHGDTPSTPQKGKRKKEGQRHGDTATPQHQRPQRPRRHPSINPPRLLWYRPPRGRPAADDLHHPPARPSDQHQHGHHRHHQPPACCTCSTVYDRDGHQHEERREGEGQKRREGRRCKTKKPSPTPSKS